MPNWVYNTVTVSGDREKIDEFVEQAGKRAQFWDAEDGKPISALSFWNFIKPDDSILDEYWGGGALSLEDRRNNSNNWYDWNVRNWGTKWDACDVERDDVGDCVTYTFNTAWAPPEPVFEVMIAEYPELYFEVSYLEEQGWGGEFNAEGGEIVSKREWDIPDSHSESIEHKGWCQCEEMCDDESEWMYDDCPKVVASKKEEVTA